MSVINATPLLAAAGGDYQISRSVRLRSSASAYFNRTPASAGNRKTWTWSGWVKRGALGSYQNFMRAGSTLIRFTNTDTIQFESNSTNVVTSAVFRDPSAWYHVAFAIDTTQATSANRTKIYVNGVLQSLTGTYVTQNVDTDVNNTTQHNIGASVTPSEFLDGYMTEINFIDGQALTPSSFGETDAITGVWKPKKYAGTYGTNGFYLNFSDNSSNTATTIGKDYSGNGNNWTPNNISVTAGVTYDSMIDVPTLYADGGNGRGNYAVLNPLDQFRVGTPSNGNLSIAGTGSCKATFAYPSGKWYYEFLVSGISGVPFVGVATADTNGGITSGNYWLYRSDGQKQTTSGASSYGSSYTSGDVIGVAYDADTNTLTFYKNNTSQGDISVTSGYVLFPMVVQSSSTSYELNFGQRPFTYTPPTGFKALNTQNLPAPTILKGNQYFNTVLYTGNGTSQSVSGVGFQPDFVWLKARSNAQNHTLYDAVRGTTKYLISNATTAETTNSETLKTFDSDGFSLGNAFPNDSGYTYVAWNWKANGSAVTNTSGSISSQVNAGTSQGFSVVTYTGNGTNNATVGHGLGVAPSLIFIKRRAGTAQDWGVYHVSGGRKALQLNTTNAYIGSGANYWDAVPTSTVFYPDNVYVADHYQNVNAATYVAYCFSEVAGFSKFGSYTGNGSTDGPFVYVGFRPRWIMVKRTDAGPAQWVVVDTSRSPINAAYAFIYANLSNAEDADSAAYNEDILANGWKIRSSNGNVNTNGGTYIFAAFAESPFKNSLAR
jgi:hypothetical protein